MKWTDAAEKVLRAVQKPLNYRALAAKLLKQKMVATATSTPAITLYASISGENKRRIDQGVPLRFDVEGGVVSLSEWRQGASETSLSQQLEKLRTTVKEELLKKLATLTGEQFEAFIQALLIKMGYSEVTLHGGPSDEGIDLFCQVSLGINQVKTAVQAKCKIPRNKVGPKDVRLLRDVLPKFKCSQGVLITTSTFTPQASEAAGEEGRLPIILIDGDRVAELALEHEVGVIGYPVRTYSLDQNFELFRKPEAGKRRGT